MPFFRKKPVVIEMRRLDGSNWSEVADWCGATFASVKRGLIISTLEGEMFAGEGDYVAKGVRGEFYPIKPHIVADTYEEVADAGA